MVLKSDNEEEEPCQKTEIKKKRVKGPKMKNTNITKE